MFFIVITIFTLKQYDERLPLKTVTFRKTLIAFDLDEKLTQNNYVVLCAKRLSLSAFCGWSSAFNFIIWFANNTLILILFVDFDFVCQVLLII